MRLQGMWRRRKLDSVIRYVREKLTCSVCMEEGVCYSCRNGHPTCRQCLSMRSWSNQAECCTCRDDRGFVLSPFVKQADAFGMQTVCEECGSRSTFEKAALHRATCEMQTLACPVPSCSRHVVRRELVRHLQRDHEATDRLVSREGRVGLLSVGGTGNVVVVGPTCVAIVQVYAQVCSMYGSDNHYVIQVSTLGTEVDVVLSNIDVHTGAVREWARVPSPAFHTPVTCARMKSHAKTEHQGCVTYGLHAVDVPAEWKAGDVLSAFRGKHVLPRCIAPVHENDSFLYDTVRSSCVACFGVEFVPRSSPS